mmetsp:Transcript_54305/g.87728  ORF Transcript_54305/g.87728 Transcript_54305/m.87728 type:complete len:105 (+) Transcript_54305:113-427(+)
MYGFVASLFTSCCSIWADYVHIEDPQHLAHLVDRWAAFHFFFVLVCECAYVLHMPIWYLTMTLCLALALFSLSRSSRSRQSWVLLHSAWHVLPMGLLLLPGLIS